MLLHIWFDDGLNFRVLILMLNVFRDIENGYLMIFAVMGDVFWNSLWQSIMAT